jgi:chromatin segregation and condensation protein Rec8/ScpA/Scc1 (kleisin family)
VTPAAAAVRGRASASSSNRSMDRPARSTFRARASSSSRSSGLLDLAEQFGAAVQAALASGHAPLSRLGDWLVMAAQLAWLRSRLLLPADADEREQARRDAEALRRRLADRAHARRLADWLEARHQLGRDVFARGVAVEAAAAGMDRAVPTADIAALFRACLAVLERSARGGSWRPEPLPLWRVPDALSRLRRMLPALPEGGTPLERFLPEMGRTRRPVRRCDAGRRWPARCSPRWNSNARGARRSRRRRPSPGSRSRRPRFWIARAVAPMPPRRRRARAAWNGARGRARGVRGCGGGMSGGTVRSGFPAC